MASHLLLVRRPLLVRGPTVLRALHAHHSSTLSPGSFTPHPSNPTPTANATMEPPLSRLHSSTLSPGSFDHALSDPPAVPAAPTTLPPLARLPTQQLLRSLLLTSAMLSPTLLRLTIPQLLSRMHLLDRPTPLKFALDHTFYPQYCTGSTPTEISRSLETLSSLDLGVILHYAREASETDTTPQLDLWLSGTLRTIGLTPEGDYAAIKFTGIGNCSDALHNSLPPTPEIADALKQVCALAKKRGVKVLVDAEHLALQPGIDAWTRELMKEYNTDSAVVWNTYQMYLRRSPAVLAADMAFAKQHNVVLGAKIVRGAYMGSDPREAMCASKADTDAAYDAAIETVLRVKRTEVMVATHNRASTMRAREVARGVGRKVTYAQLLGMADELSLEVTGLGERCVKYAVWGSTRECVDYLLRRVEENSDVSGRGQEEFWALWGEVKRRMGMGANA